MANGTTGPGSPAIAAGAYDNTGNVFLDVLVGWGWLDVGHDRNITYYFDQTSPYHQWSNFEMGTWRAALQEWVNVANITTQEVSSASGADLLETWSNPQTLTNQFGLDPNGFPWEAAHYLPHPEGDSPGEYDYIYQLSDYSQSALTPGANGYRIFVHEIGHALGLSHPHGMVQLDNEPTFPGVTLSGDMGDFGYNQMVYAIMSYNRGTYVNRFNDYGQPAAPMAFDIAAIQFLYGPNTTYHSGSDTYVLPDDNAAGTFWQCIWDTGGIDTIRYDGKLNATIDLRPATLVFGDPIAGGAISKADGIFGGFTIAMGVVIENAIGGSGNDTLVGNSADNVLNGNAGDDTAVYSGNRSSYAVQNLGDRIVVSGADGTDTLFSIEHVKFADITLNLSSGNVQFDTHPAGWTLAGVGDLNGDGTSDVVWYDASKGNTVDLWKVANGQWAGSVDLGSHPAGSQLAGIGDLNGDGTGDLLWFNPATGNVDLWKISNGQLGSSVNIGPHPLGYQVAGIADFDHDGTNDVLWYNPTNGATDIWKIVNGQWSASFDAGSHPLGWTPAGTGDFNHDGTGDIAWYNSTTGDIDIWQIVNGHWSASVDVGSHPLGWAPAGIGDFNHDGTDDIAWYNSATGNVDIWQIVNAHWAGSVNLGSHPLV